MPQEMQPLVNGNYLLEKYPGAGGWTYAAIPEVAQNPNAPFGWVKVKVHIDGIDFGQMKLMPMGAGRLFLPLRADIRKKIRKQAGDTVSIVLFPDEDPILLPPELIECLRLGATDLYPRFRALPEGEQKAKLDWIYAAKTEATQAERIAQLVEALEKAAEVRV
jgi:hypothetical protein